MLVACAHGYISCAVWIEMVYDSLHKKCPVKKCCLFALLIYTVFNVRKCCSDAVELSLTEVRFSMFHNTFPPLRKKRNNESTKYECLPTKLLTLFGLQVKGARFSLIHLHLFRMHLSQLKLHFSKTDSVFVLFHIIHNLPISCDVALIFLVCTFIQIGDTKNTTFAIIMLPLFAQQLCKLVRSYGISKMHDAIAKHTFRKVFVLNKSGMEMKVYKVDFAIWCDSFQCNCLNWILYGLQLDLKLSKIQVLICFAMIVFFAGQIQRNPYSMIHIIAECKIHARLMIQQGRTSISSVFISADNDSLISILVWKIKTSRKPSILCRMMLRTVAKKKCWRKKLKNS